MDIYWLQVNKCDLNQSFETPRISWKLNFARSIWWTLASKAFSKSTKTSQPILRSWRAFLVFSVIKKQPPKVLCEKGVLRNFKEFTGKHRCLSLFLNKVASLSLFNSFYLTLLSESLQKARTLHNFEDICNL